MTGNETYLSLPLKSCCLSPKIHYHRDGALLDTQIGSTSGLPVKWGLKLQYHIFGHTYTSKENVCCTSFGIIFWAGQCKQATFRTEDIVCVFLSLTRFLHSLEQEISRMHTALYCSPNPLDTVNKDEKNKIYMILPVDELSVLATPAARAGKTLNNRPTDTSFLEIAPKYLAETKVLVLRDIP